MNRTQLIGRITRDPELRSTEKLLADAPVLVLDEPTAHLDPATAAELVRRRLRRRRGPLDPPHHAPSGGTRARRWDRYARVARARRRRAAAVRGPPARQDPAWRLPFGEQFSNEHAASASRGRASVGACSSR
jgi:hypothetical protein